MKSAPTQLALMTGAAVLLTCGVLGGAACSTFGSDSDPPDDTEGGGVMNGNDGGPLIDGSVDPSDARDANDANDATSKCPQVDSMFEPTSIITSGPAIMDFDVDDLGVFWVTSEGAVSGASLTGTNLRGLGSLSQPAHFALTDSSIVLTTTSGTAIHALSKSSNQMDRPGAAVASTGSRVVGLTGDNIVFLVGAVPIQLATCDVGGSCAGASLGPQAPSAITALARYQTLVFFAFQGSVSTIDSQSGAPRAVTTATAVTALTADADHVYFPEAAKLRSALHVAPATTVSSEVGSLAGTTSALATSTLDVYVGGSVGLQVLPKAGGGCAPLTLVPGPITQVRVRGGYVYYAAGDTIARFPELPPPLP